jgi:hypothetical protein
VADLRIERVVVTGGRHFTDGLRIAADLRALQGLGLHRLAHGGALGADDVAAAAWRALPHEFGWSIGEHAADWATEGSGAGPRRNIRMLEAEKPDLVLAYPDPTSKGTWHCVAEALKRDITVAIWTPLASPTTQLSDVGRRVAMPITVVDEAPRFILARQGAPARGWDRQYMLQITEALRG